MPVTLEDLIDSVRRLADSNLATAAALNKLLPPFEQLRRDIYDIKAAREIDNDRVDMAISKLNTDLAVILEGVRNAQGDMRMLSRDVTASHALPTHIEPSTAERLIERFERMPTSTKLWLFALVLIVVGGFGLHLIFAALGIGG